MGIIGWGKIIALIAALAIGASAAWWVQGVRLDKVKQENATQKEVINQQQKTLEWYQKSAEIDVDTQKQKEEFHEILKSNDPQRIIEFFDRMRNLSSNPGQGED